MICCNWIRLLINNWFYFIDIASVVGALVDPLETNIVASVTSAWFPVEQQVGAISVIACAGVLGPVTGSFYSLVYINTNVNNIDDAKRMIYNASLFLAITYTCLYIVGLVFFKSSPESPPG